MAVFSKTSTCATMSAEPGRKKAYSIDLRWRVVYQRIGMNLSFPKIAERMNIAISTVYRIYAHFEQTGEVEPLPPTARCDSRKLDEHGELYIIGLVMDNPSMYLAEVCQAIQDVLGITVSASTICRLLRRCGLTRKKIRQVALKRCEKLRGAFMAQTFLLRRDMFVWVDESGSDARDHIRKYGFALIGVTPTYHRLLSRGKRVNAIAAMASTGVLALELTTSTVTGETFFDFVRGSLIPNMLPYDGINPRSVAVMDNCSVHHIDEVKKLFSDAGIVLLFIPPYSPDLEELFSFVKYYLKEHDELIQSAHNLTDVIQAAFDSVTEELCNSWISHSGYVE